MNFNFHNFRKPRRLFLPVNTFSFAAFVVPIKFRTAAFMPVPAFATVRKEGFSRARRLDGGAN